MASVDRSGALRHLRRVDPVLGAFIRSAGPCALRPERGESPYEALVHAVAHQQLHRSAAEAIFARFLALFPGPGFPEPQAVLAADPAGLRATGFSAAKIATIRAISEAAISGVIPTRRAAARLSDEALIERLTSVRGIGRWTVEMLLIFTLGRPDILPVDDFGIREGYRLLHGLAVQPKPRALAEIGAVWAPYRSTASWYLWQRARQVKAEAEAAKQAAKGEGRKGKPGPKPRLKSSKPRPTP
ncbi:MAG TPA: DNA-3-methyladenine glycosylase [Acetobacteraceae bacterium]|nr:DNA-3-methyladenine glycosylase [Acetobacteraceae bacterium]